MKARNWSAGLVLGIVIAGSVGLALLVKESSREAGKRPVEWLQVHRSNLSGSKNWFWQQRAYPVGAIPANARISAMQQKERMRPFSHSAAGLAGNDAVWTPLGPSGYDSAVIPTWGRQSGRIRAFLVDPTDTSRLFLGTATGGVWRSTNRGATWMPISDDQDSLSIGSLAMDPQNSDVIYAGTGEGPAGAYYSVGILKSTDGGDTWTRLASETFSRHALAEILVSPTDSDIVLACATSGTHIPGDSIERDEARSGIFRSTDGGMTFTQTQVGDCQDLIASPANFNNQFASLTEVEGLLFPSESDGIYRSNDGGQNWTQVESDGAPIGVPRVNIGVSADGMTLYAGGQNEFEETTIWKSVDGGANWQALAGAPDYCETQCGYDNEVVVSPTNPDHAYFAGVPFYRTLDGGLTFDQIGANNESIPQGTIHVDHHIMVFEPGDPNTLYLGNDGGIFRSSNISDPGDVATPGPIWASLTGNTLQTLQLYDLQLHPTDPEVMIEGTQDNGTHVRSAATGNIWTERCGGDGSSVLIDHTNPNIMYCSFPFSQDFVPIEKSTDGGVTFPQDVSIDVGADNSGFVTPLAMDPVTSTTIYAGTDSLWRSLDGGASWAPIGPDDLTNAGGTISALEIAPSNPQVIWVATSNGLVQRSINGGQTFTDTTAAPLPGRFATSVAIHPTDPNIAYVGFTGFDDGTPGSPGHLFGTMDGGASWTNLTGDLPDIPVNAVAVHPDSPSTIYAGTDVGLFASNAGAGGAPAGDPRPSGGPLVAWAKFTGLPNVAIIKIRTNVTTNRLVVATYGRSVFSTQLAPTEHFLYFPFVEGDASNFSGFAFTNDSDQAAQLRAEAFQSDGNPQPYPVNPADFELGSKQQVARLAADYFGVDAATTPRDGWIRVRSDIAEIASFFQFGNGLGGNMSKLDGSVALGSQSLVLYFTRLYDGAGSFPTANDPLDAETQLAIANPNDEPISLTLRLFDSSGQQVGEDAIRVLLPLGCLLESLTDLFDPGVISNGFVRVDVGGPGAVGFQRILLDDTLLGFNASPGNTESVSYSAQLAHGSVGDVGIFTSIKLVNVANTARSVTLRAVDAQGQPLGEVNITLQPNQSFQQDLGEALGLGPITGPSVTGSVTVEADGPGVIGDVVFGEADSVRFGAALPLQTELLKRAIFGQVANLENANQSLATFTGLAFQNPQTEAAEITIRVFNGAGVEVGSTRITLQPGTRISEVVAILIPASAGQAGGYIVVESTQAIVGQQLFGNLALDYLSAVPPTVFE